MAAMVNTLTQITLSAPGGFSLRGFRPSLAKVLRKLAIKRCHWNILIVRDARMKELHLAHLNDPTTTDVLTFDMRDDPGERHEVQLDTVLCLDEARRQARARGHAVTEELILYAVHSLLHVCGYDDTTPELAAKMHQREDELLGAIGIGPIYRKARGVARNRKSGAPPAVRNRKSRRAA
jgi:probable rRNA maturation factor